MSIAVENEKVFEYFVQLFPEIRKVVIDEMQTVDRCRFTRCAKFCQKEAKKSKNYIYGLSFYVYDFSPHFSLNIFVHFDKFGNGFRLNFSTDAMSGEKYKTCMNLQFEELWKIELDCSRDVIQHGAEEFKCLLQLYQDSIQWLSIDGSRYFLKKFDFGFKSLKNLTKLEIKCDMNLSQIFSKLKKPLKELVVHGIQITQNIVDFEEIYQVQNKITLWNVGVNYEQLTRLSAKHIELDTRSLTEMDIFNLIRSWQNSTDWKATKHYYWDLIGSRFSFQHLLDLLGIAGFDAYSWKQLPIKHFKDDQKVGELRYSCSNFTLKFEE